LPRWSRITGWIIDPLRRDPWLVVPPIAFVVTTAVVFGDHRWDINPDGVSYMAIAQHYVAGSYRVNAYWSPLFSWLLVPLYKLGIEPVFGAKLLQAGCGLALVVAALRLCGGLGVRGVVRAAVGLALAGLVVQWALSEVTPDVLEAAILVVWLDLLVRAGSAPLSYRRAIALGMVIGLAYFGKLATLPICLLFLSVWFAARAWRRRTPAEAHLRHWLVAVGACAAIVAPWAVAISSHEGHLTLGTSSSYNLAVPDPAFTGISAELTNGFIPPPSPVASSAWEDPPKAVPVPPWTPIEHISYAATYAWGQLTAYFTSLRNTMWLGLVLGLLALLLPGVGARSYLVASFAVLVIVAYSPESISERYVYTAEVVVLALAGVAVMRLSTAGIIGPAALVCMAVALVWSTAIPSLKYLAQLVGPTGPDIHGVAVADHAELAGARIASSVSVSGWYFTLYLSFEAGGQYYGAAGATETTAELTQDIRRLGIDAYVYWGPVVGTPPYLPGFRALPQSTIDGTPVTIFVSRNELTSSARPGAVRDALFAADTLGRGTGGSEMGAESQRRTGSSDPSGATRTSLLARAAGPSTRTSAVRGSIRSNATRTRGDRPWPSRISTPGSSRSSAPTPDASAARSRGRHCSFCTPTARNRAPTTRRRSSTSTTTGATSSSLRRRERRPTRAGTTTSRLTPTCTSRSATGCSTSRRRSSPAPSVTGSSHAWWS
jgi:hypothetical protein